MRIMKTICFLIAVVLVTNLNAQKLDKFGADMGMKTVMNKDIRVPYTDVISFYGFIKPGSKPDQVRDGKNFFYLYLWIPAVAPELGIRMASPVPEKMAPGEGDIVDAIFKENAADKTSYFDTWVSLERSDVINAADIKAKGKTAKWFNLGQNDDSGEMPAQPSGSKYNSLMRVTSDVNDPLKALTVGLYRIGFTTYKVGEVNGSFIAQVGAPIKLPGVKIARSLDELADMIGK
jgi:hypothetical protein